jgi:hypothetical protein
MNHHATSPVTHTQESADSASTWPRFSVLENGTSAFFTPRFGNETLRPNELAAARFPSFSSFPPTKGQTLSTQNPSLSSWERALEQVHALIDLYGNNTSHQDSISEDILMTAVKSLIHRQRTNMLQTLNTLPRLEELVWRLQHLRLRPIRSLLEETWNLQQLELHQSQQHNCNHRLLVEKHAKLLFYWIQWSQQERQQQVAHEESHFEARLRPPSPDYVITTFQLAVRSKASESHSLWSLYSLLQSNAGSYNDVENTDNIKAAYLSREFYSTVLRLTLVAPSNNVSPCQVLQDMGRQYRATNSSWCRPTVPELQGALELASRNGNATEAAWLFQRLLESCEYDQDDDSIGSLDGSIADKDLVDKVGNWRLLLLTALSRSGSPPAAAIFAQRLLTKWEEQPHGSSGNVIPPHCNLYYQLLRMWAASRITGAGRTAEAIYRHRFDQNVTKFQARRDVSSNSPTLPFHAFPSWVSQDEIMHQVVLAYLQELPSSFQNVREADRFVRSVILAHPPEYRHCALERPREEESKRGKANIGLTSFPTTENVLAAYCNYSEAETSSIMHGERLFRFLLIQHRDGRTHEEPNPTHLKYVLNIIKDLEHGDTTCVVLFRLVSSLAKSKVISNPPDGHNICQLLKIMSDSGRPGYSLFAREIFQLLQNQKKIPNEQIQLAASHLAQCVQHEKGITGSIKATVD